MIIKLWRFLFGGCDHQWEILRQNALILHDEFDKGQPSTGTRFYLRCTKCGNVKKRDLA